MDGESTRYRVFVVIRGGEVSGSVVSILCIELFKDRTLWLDL